MLADINCHKILLFSFFASVYKCRSVIGEPYVRVFAANKSKT